MQAQTTQMKGELISELQGKIVGVTIKELSPLGVRMEINAQAQVTGKYSANQMHTSTSFQKTDGSIDWETKAIQTTSDGDFIVVAGRGTGRSTGPTTRKWEGELHFMTQSPKLAGLNTTKGWQKEPATRQQAPSTQRSTPKSDRRNLSPTFFSTPTADSPYSPMRGSSINGFQRFPEPAQFSSDTGDSLP